MNNDNLKTKKMFKKIELINFACLFFIKPSINEKALKAHLLQNFSDLIELKKLTFQGNLQGTLPFSKFQKNKIVQTFEVNNNPE